MSNCNQTSTIDKSCFWSIYTMETARAKKRVSSLQTTSSSKKSKTSSIGPRKTIKNISNEKMFLIQRLDEWVKEAMQRERFGEKVFPSK